MIFVNATILRVTAPMTERHDFVAGLPAGSISAGRHNLTGNLQAMQGIGIGRYRIQAEQLHHIPSSDTCRMDLDEDL